MAGFPFLGHFAAHLGWHPAVGARKAVEGLTVPAKGMLSDMHGTAAYRANLVKVLTKRAVSAA